MISAPVWALLGTVFVSIIQVFLLCFAGWYLCKVGILDKKSIYQMNALNLSLFTPALVFSKVAFSLSPDQLKELWVIPLFCAIISSLSLALARTTARIFRLSRMQRDFATANAMFMNCNTLPVALMQSLVYTVPQLRLDENDNSEAELGRSLTYLFLFASLSITLRWSYGVKLLETEPEDLSDGASTPQVGLIDGSIPLSILSTDASRKLSHINEKRPNGNPITRYMQFVRQIMSPPLAASLASLFVAMIPPLQTFLTNYASPLKMAISNAGDCSIPLTLVVLGAYFWEPKPTKGGNIAIAGDDSSFELRIGTSAMKKPSRICRLSFSDESKTVIAALLTRMILVPLLIMPLLYYSAVAGLHSVFEDPVFIVSMILLAGSPPGLTLAQVVPKASGDAFERLISRSVFWSYCILTPPTVVLYASWGLWISAK